LVRVVKEGADPVAVAAANSLLDRGYGKPVQAITGADSGPLVITCVGMPSSPIVVPAPKLVSPDTGTKLALDKPKPSAPQVSTTVY
jgi:hypothetical protein